LRRAAWLLVLLGVLVLVATFWRTPSSVDYPPQTASRPNIVLVTIDTLRADRVGAYGAATARTPTLDRLARAGARFDRAYAVSPITLTSHASVLTGLYPPGHGARHNGIRVKDGVPTLAGPIRANGYAAGAFVSAFPLDRRFGLAAGFDVYDDRMPRGSDGRLANERPASRTVDAALAWVSKLERQRPFFMWVHLFEPHAPYEPQPGLSNDEAPVMARYDAEVAVADRETGRLLDGMDGSAASIVVVAGDHGEAFGEHGEIGHSIFVYDTTLRVPLLIRAPGLSPAVVSAPVTLADVVPTVLRLAGLEAMDADGMDVSPALRGGTLPPRELYAESFAPLVDFGWSPLRALRTGPWKFIEAPRPELFQIVEDPGETRDRASDQRVMTTGLHERLSRYGPADLPRPTTGQTDGDRESLARLRALGYASGARTGVASRADPKDRRELAAAIGRVTSGELSGDALVAALERILAEDPGNPQAHLRLGFELAARERCDEAAPHFEVSARSLASADPFLGLAGCQMAAGRLDDTEQTLTRAREVEQGNPVVIANLGVVDLERGRVDRAVSRFQEALAADPDLHQARFNLARALGRAGRRAEALAEARTLLERLPPSAPQRAEVQRLLQALQ
jgi:arylsulfatase A-like enzyme/Flp pilus assembly protein TadD